MGKIYILEDDKKEFIKNYQAVYYAMNAKPDCKSKIFPEDVIIEFHVR